MHVRIRSSPVVGKTCMALLLGAATITMVIPGGDVALGQRGTGIRAQAPFFTAINLHPRGFTKSYALGVSGGQQVGVGVTPGDFNHGLLWRGSATSVMDLIPSRGESATAICSGQQVGYGHGFGANETDTHALLWRGSVASVVDIHPSGFTESEAFGTSGEQQVGVGSGPATGGDHALLWRGSAASVVDLHPRGFDYSQALATSGGEQVGYGHVGTGKGYHALLWRGNAASVVDLHPRGFDNSEAHGASGGQQVGYGSGPATGAFPLPGTAFHAFHDHALLWRGSAASVVDLNPPRFITSYAYATNGKEQVGAGSGPATRDEGHALLWLGSAASVVDLHAFLPLGFVHSIALAIDAAGDIVGNASHVTGPAGDSYAILWKRNVPRPGTSLAQNAVRC